MGFRQFIGQQNERQKFGVACVGDDFWCSSACLELDQTAQIISYEEYHPFGTTSYRSGHTETEVSLKRYKYVGKERDEETGLYYYGARYYAAWICRFVSVDPLQFDYPQLTPYNYAGNKPVTHIDIDGMQSTGDEPIQSNNGSKLNENPFWGEQSEKNNTYFFSKRIGKYLGQLNIIDCAGAEKQINGMILRVIDEADYEHIKKNGEGYENFQVNIIRDSIVIDIDVDSFSVFNKINESGTIAGSPEKALTMVLDLSVENKATLRAVYEHDVISDNSSFKVPYDNRYNDRRYRIDNPNQIVIGQAHSHPLMAKVNLSDRFSTISFSPERYNLPGVSFGSNTADLEQAVSNKYPSYAIQSYDNSGYIYKVDQYGGLNLTNPKNMKSQIPVGNINNIGIGKNQFNILLDSFFTYSNFYKK